MQYQQQQQQHQLTQQHQGYAQQEEKFYDTHHTNDSSIINYNNNHHSQHMDMQSATRHSSIAINSRSFPAQQQPQQQQPQPSYHYNNDERYRMNPNYIQPVSSVNNNNDSTLRSYPSIQHHQQVSSAQNYPSSYLLNPTTTHTRNNNMYSDDRGQDSFYSARQSMMMGSSVAPGVHANSYHNNTTTTASLDMKRSNSGLRNYSYMYNTPVQRSVVVNPTLNFDDQKTTSTTSSSSQFRYESFTDYPTNQRQHEQLDVNDGSQYHDPINTDSKFPSRQALEEVSVRIVSAETRYDITKKEYTAYVIRVVRPGVGISNEVERRYSEFYKLYTTLKKTYTIIAPLGVNFPSKHWAGRLGDWTPSKLWTPESYEELIHNRTIELDLWLVQIVSLYNASFRSNNDTNPTSSPLSSNIQFSVPYMDCRFIPKPAQELIHAFLFIQHQAPCQVQPIEKSDGRIICVTADENDVNTLQHTFLKSMNINTGSDATSASRSIKSTMGITKWNNPFSFTVSSAIRQATTTVEYMTASSPLIGINDTSIPLDLLRCAKGIAFLTVLKAGMVVSGRIGTGIVIAKLNSSNDSTSDSPPWATASPTHYTPNSSKTSSTAADTTPTTGFSTPHTTRTRPASSQWSCPCAIGTIGMGWGAQMGGDVTHYMIVFTSEQAIYDFCSIGGDTSIQVGAEMSIAVGPIGRGAVGSMTAGDWSVHPAYAYTISQGLFVGISIEGSVVTVRHDINSKFYEEYLTNDDDHAFVGMSGGSNRNSYRNITKIVNSSNKNNTSTNASSSAISILQRPGCPAAKLLYNALDNALATEIPKYGFRPSLLFQNNTDTD